MPIFTWDDDSGGGSVPLHDPSDVRIGVAYGPGNSMVGTYTLNPPLASGQSIDLTTFMAKVVAWASGQMDITVIQGRQSEHRPPRPYAEVQYLTGPIKTGFDDSAYDSTLNEWVISGPREVTLQINFFGSEALAELTTLVSSREDINVRAFFAVFGIVLVGFSGIRDLSAVESGSFQTRGHVDATFRLKSLVVPSGTVYIGSVEAENEINESTFVVEP